MGRYIGQIKALRVSVRQCEEEAAAEEAKVARVGSGGHGRGCWVVAKNSQLGIGAAYGT